jgi:hypothetical protein
MGADSRPLILLPNTSKKTFPSTRRILHRAGPTSQTPYQILVLTVLTLTSKSVEIYLSMASANLLSDTRFILVPTRAVRQAGVCSGHCIALRRSVWRGVLQARQERRLTLQVPEVLIE